VFSVCTSQGEKFQTHPKRKKIEMELCYCTLAASSCYTLFVSNNTYCLFFVGCIAFDVTLVSASRSRYCCWWVQISWVVVMVVVLLSVCGFKYFCFRSWVFLKMILSQILIHKLQIREVGFCAQLSSPHLPYQNWNCVWFFADTSRNFFSQVVSR
jgi:hypothetical protein